MPNYHYTQDWFTPWCLTVWPNVLKEYVDKPDVRFLEIGSFEGRATCWLLENILTHDSARITCIDTWTGSPEHAGMNVMLAGLFERFLHNITETGVRHKVKFLIGKSVDELPRLLDRQRCYDVVYIDGSHTAYDVLQDICFVWNITKTGGLIICDDYGWPHDFHETQKPQIALDAFLRCFAGQYEVVHKEYQLIIRKRV